MKTKRHNHDQRGVALVTTVIVVAVLAVVAVAFMQSTSMDRLSSRRWRNYYEAQLAAEAGLATVQQLIGTAIGSDRAFIVSETNHADRIFAGASHRPAGRDDPHQHVSAYFRARGPISCHYRGRGQPRALSGSPHFSRAGGDGQSQCRWRTDRHQRLPPPFTARPGFTSPTSRATRPTSCVSPSSLSTSRRASTRCCIRVWPPRRGPITGAAARRSEWTAKLSR